MMQEYATSPGAAAATDSSDGNLLPQEPGLVQVAQASGAPIGEVTELTGSAATLRAAGGTEPLALGTPMFEDDSVLTQPGSSVTVTFVDGTEFTLAGDGQIVLDRMIYDPNGSDNELAIDLLKGSFAFISGEVSKVAGPGLSLDTPVGTIGVRGTAVIGDFDLVRLLVTLLQGAIGFSNNVAQALMATTLDTLQVNNADQPDLDVQPMTPEEQAVYGDLLPRILEKVVPEAGEQQQDGGQEGGTRVAPQQPAPDAEGNVDPDESEDQSGLDELTEGDIRDIAAAILEELAEESGSENPNLFLLTEDTNGGTEEAADPPAGGPADGSFETGFTGWTTQGETSIQTAAFGSGPIEGLNQALVTSDEPDSIAAAQIEAQLGLALGSLTGLGNGPATEGSFITAEFTLNAGDVLSFDFNFLTDEIPAGGEVNDFAFVVIDGQLFELADTFDPLVPSNTIFVDETGFQTFEFTAEQGGVIQLAIGAADVDDFVVDSGILIDNVVVTPAGGGDNEDIPQLIDA